MPKNSDDYSFSGPTGPEEYPEAPHVRFLMSSTDVKYQPYTFSAEELRDLATMGYTDDIRFVVQNMPIEVDGRVVEHATDGGVISSVEIADASTDAIVRAISSYIEKYGYDSVDDFATVAEVVASDFRVSEDVDVEPDYQVMGPTTPSFTDPVGGTFKITINQRTSFSVKAQSMDYVVSGEVLSIFRSYVEPDAGY